MSQIIVYGIVDNSVITIIIIIIRGVKGRLSRPTGFDTELARAIVLAELTRQTQLVWANPKVP